MSARHLRSSLRWRSGNSARSVCAGIAVEADVHRVAQRQHPRRQVDLDAARLALLGEELGVRKARADHQQRVASGHELVARPGAEQADRAGHERQIVGDDGLAEQRLRDAGSEHVGDGEHLVGRSQGPGTHEHRHPLAGVQDLRGGTQIVLGRQDDAAVIADPGQGGAVLARRRIDPIELLDVVGDDHAGHDALGERDPHRSIDQVSRRRGVRARVHVVMRDVLEQRLEIDLLLVVGPHGGARRLADDRDHRLMIHLRIVEAVEQVDRARPGGRQADADLPGELRVTAGHERGGLLVARLDEADPTLGAIEGPDQPVDAITGIPVDGANAPRVQPLDDVIAHGLGHGPDGLHAACPFARRGSWWRVGLCRARASR